MAFEKIEDVNERHLHILWASGDPVTAEHMVLMYATNSLLLKWWDEVTVIVWGAAQLVVKENASVRESMEKAKEAGVKFTGCLSCAMNLGTEDAMKEAGVETIYWGGKLAELQQNGKHVLSV